MKITEEVFKKHYPGEYHCIPIEDIPDQYLEKDKGYKIMITVDPGYYSENNSWDSYTELIIYKQRDQTKEEEQEYKEKREKLKKEFRQERYNTYLELKKEFEEGDREM